MFFRRKKKFQSPIKGEDGYYYAEEGQEYDSEEFETDSDDSQDDESSSSSDGSVNSHHSDSDESTSQDFSNNGSREDHEPEIDENAECNGVVVGMDNADEEEARVEPKIKDNAREKERIRKNESNADACSETLEAQSRKDDALEDQSVHERNTNDVVVVVDSSKTDNNSSQSIRPCSKDGKAMTGLDEEISLHEKRALIALAAEHDRVDILKFILQPSSNRNSTALAQLLLNNMIIQDNGRYTKDDLESVFLPPLHIAIASCSVNAASCLLRMGSNPAIRPDIPEDWEGPGWTDENGDAVLEQGQWEIFRGMSAWEIAFGALRVRAVDQQQQQQQQKDVKRGWFGFRSSRSSENVQQSQKKQQQQQQQQEIPELFIPVKMDSSKLEGIRHAFTAEALRAIGSDEVDRLEELLESGLGSMEPIEIGGKDLYGWCLEMGAKKCTEMMTKSNNNHKMQRFHTDHSQDSIQVGEDSTGDMEQNRGNDSLEMEESGTNHHSDIEGFVYDEATLEDLQNKLEETRSLETALTSMLDNLAEEVSVTQGLLMQEGDDSNSSLLLQVRQIKTQRAQVEDEISLWEGYLADRYAELDMVTIWWQKRGGNVEDIIIPEVVTSEQQAPLESNATPNVLSQDDLKEQIIVYVDKLEQAENNVKKLRNSISGLSKESLYNLQKVEKLGLMGAVKLTRKLKEEVRERKETLDAIVREEASVKHQVKVMRQMLEQSDGFNGKTLQDHSNAVPSRDNTNLVHTNTQEEAKDDDEQEQEKEQEEADRHNKKTVASEEIQENHSNHSIASESTDCSNRSTESEDEKMTHSEAIQRGHSTAIVEWVDDGDLGIFTFKVWALLQKIVGSSEKDVSQSENEDVVMNMPRVMIV